MQPAANENLQRVYFSMNVSSSLIKRCLKGDERAQNELFKQCFQLLMGIAMRYYSNQMDAQDALNKGFYRILTKLDQHDTTKSFEAWAKRVMITTILNDLRTNKKYKENFQSVDLQEEEFKLNISADEINEKFDADEILNLIQSLPDREREILNLYAFDGYNHQEISEQLQIPEGTSKWLLSNARKSLSKALKKVLSHGLKMF